MRTGKQTLISTVVVALAGLAIGIPTAFASGQSPDSRPFYRGTDPALAPKSPSPDDRSFNRAIPVSSNTIVASPDDRAFSRAIPVSATTIASPDDRAFSRAIPVSSHTIVGSPDDRAFARSTPVQPTALAAPVSVESRGFAWGDALIGGTFGLVLALLGAGAVAIALHHRRGVLRTA